MSDESHIVYVQAGERRRPWGAFHSAAAATKEAAKLRMGGFDARVALGRIICGEVVLASTERSA